MLLGDGLAVGPDEPRLGLAAGLEPDRHVLAGLLAGDLDRRAPLVLGIEEVDGSGLLRVEAVQLEAAVAGVELEADVAPPGRVERLDAERREDHRVRDRLPSGPITRPLIVPPGRSAASTSWGGRRP